MPARQGTWNGAHWIRREKRLAIYLRDQFRCVYCNRNLAKVKAKLRVLDHVIPVTKGGTNHESNLATCCSRCNNQKGDRVGGEFLFVKYRTDLDKFIKFNDRLNQLLKTPINRELGKRLLDGTLDLTDVLTKE